MNTNHPHASFSGYRVYAMLVLGNSVNYGAEVPKHIFTKKRKEKKTQWVYDDNGITYRWSVCVVQDIHIIIYYLCFFVKSVENNSNNSNNNVRCSPPTVEPRRYAERINSSAEFAERVNSARCARRRRWTRGETRVRMYTSVQQIGKIMYNLCGIPRYTDGYTHRVPGMWYALDKRRAYYGRRPVFRR